MNIPVLDEAGGGLLVLTMLTIAFIAGQAQANLQERAAAPGHFQLNTELTVTLDGDRVENLRSISSIIDAVRELPVTIDVTIDASTAHQEQTAESEQ
ncbi:MAG: hypothetical protein ACE5FV_06805 [Woeseia sp.]